MEEKEWERCKGRRPLQSPQGRAALDGHCETVFRMCVKNKKSVCM